MTIGIFLASLGAFLILVGVSGRLVIWVMEQFSR